MIFSFEETDDFEETDNFDDEPEDSYLDEEDADVVGLEDDLDDAATALSHAFREATATEVVEEDEEEEEEEEETVEEPEDEKAVEEPEDEKAVEEPEDEKAVEEPEDEKENTTEEAYNEGTEAYEQRLAEAIDALPDEEDLEVDIPPLELPPVEVEFFRPQEQDNLAYADAMKAYYEEKDYQRAIEKFREAIENEAQDTGGNVADSNSIVAKAMYWQAEAYVKMQDIPQAIVTFENLSQTYKEHYLSLAAKRRTAQLNPE